MNDIIILPTETIHPQKSSWHVKTTFIFDTDSDFTKKKHRPKKSPLDEHVPKMVTIKELSNLTGLSEYCIRKLCKQNKIHFIQTGVKHLINYEKFLDYMNGKS